MGRQASNPEVSSQLAVSPKARWALISPLLQKAKQKSLELLHERNREHLSGTKDHYVGYQYGALLAFGTDLKGQPEVSVSASSSHSFEKH